MPPVTQLEDTVYDQADFLEIDIDSVEPHETEGAGDAVKVLRLTDTGEEIGFVAAHPGGPDGDRMFKRDIKHGLRELRTYLRDGTANGADGTDEADGTNTTDDMDELEQLAAEEDDTQSVSAPTSDTADSGTDSSRQRSEASDTTQLSVTVELDEESLDDLEDCLDEAFKDVPEDLESRLDDIESRLDEIESTFGTLGS